MATPAAVRNQADDGSRKKGPSPVTDRQRSKHRRQHVGGREREVEPTGDAVDQRERCARIA